MTQSVKLINDLFICFLNYAFLSENSSQFTLNEVEMFFDTFCRHFLSEKKERKKENDVIVWHWSEKMKKSYSRI